MNHFSSGNSIIPTDAEHDEHFSIRCETCDEQLTREEIKRGPPFLCEDHEDVDNAEELE